jgi:hypothetical protein
LPARWLPAVRFILRRQAPRTRPPLTKRWADMHGRVRGGDAANIAAGGRACVRPKMCAATGLQPVDGVAGGAGQRSSGVGSKRRRTPKRGGHRSDRGQGRPRERRESFAPCLSVGDRVALQTPHETQDLRGAFNGATRDKFALRFFRPRCAAAGKMGSFKKKPGPKTGQYRGKPEGRLRRLNSVNAGVTS